MAEYLDKYNYWLSNATDETVVKQLQEMKGDDTAIMNAFYKDIEFGTAGLRGIMTAGSNNLNVYTIIKATVGLAEYMKAHGMTSTAITYDSRLNSKLFSETTACVLASYGVRVYITKECMPTPFVSYLIRSLHCDTGVNVTASHNPAEYNGYKVYDCNGCQLTDDAAMEVTGYIEKIDPFKYKLGSFDSYVNSGLITYTDDSYEVSYKNEVISQSLNFCEGLKAVYTPLNGAGYRIVPEVLRSVGLTDVTVVPQQSYPDGHFATCSYPNPEKHEAMQLAVDLAEEIGADIVIGNDPDCDRLGVAVKDGASYYIFSGNEVGVLLTDYILGGMLRQGKLPANPVVVKTIVTTIMVDSIASKYGATVEDVLTGFKYIGNVIGRLQQQGEEHRYVFGFEESCGYLKGSYVRDKDGVVASMLVAEMSAYYKTKGLTLADRLRQLYKEYGNFYQCTVSYRFDGATGAERKNKLLADLRVNPVQTLGTSKVVRSTDFLTQTQYDLPRADVIRYNAEDGSQLIIRPSGTEPLIKCYITVSGDEQGNKVRFDKIKAQTDKLFG